MYKILSTIIIITVRIIILKIFIYYDKILSPGKGRDFIPSELLTLGAVLCKAILIKELSEKKIYPLDDLIRETRLEFVNQWKKANSDFSSPVIFTDKSIDRKIRKSYCDVRIFAEKGYPKGKN